MKNISSYVSIWEDSFQSKVAQKENLFEKYIFLNANYKPEDLGIPLEKVVLSYDDFEGCHFELLDGEHHIFRLCCFFPEIPLGKRFLFQLVSILNQLSQLEIVCYLNAAVCASIIPLCNSHITIIPVEKEKQMTIKTSLLITYGLSVIHFLRQGLPVCILGPNGLGGLVTPENLPYLYASGFIGRPGGALHEKIPIEIVAHELGIFKDMKDVETLVSQNRVIAGTFLINPLSKELKIQDTLIKNLRERYYCQLRRDELKPILYSNMRMVNSGEVFHITRTILNDTVCILDKSEASFFVDLNGKFTCADLKRKYNMNSDEFWGTIDLLLEKQIITLNL